MNKEYLPGTSEVPLCYFWPWACLYCAHFSVPQKKVRNDQSNYSKQVLHLEVLKWIFQSDLCKLKWTKIWLWSYSVFFFSSRITGVMGQNKVMQIGTCNCRSRIVTSLCLFPPSPLTIATCPSVQYRSGEDFFQNLYPKMYFRNIRNLALSASTDGKSVTCHGKQH